MHDGWISQGDHVEIARTILEFTKLERKREESEKSGPRANQSQICLPGHRSIESIDACHDGTTYCMKNHGQKTKEPTEMRCESRWTHFQFAPIARSTASGKQRLAFQASLTGGTTQIACRGHSFNCDHIVAFFLLLFYRYTLSKPWQRSE